MCIYIYIYIYIMYKFIHYIATNVLAGTRMACGLRSVGVDCRIFQRENLSTGDVFQPYPKS